MLDSEVNAVINDIMTCDAKSVFMICDGTYNRVDLLRELCNRHYKHYRFNPVTDDFFRLGATLCASVLGNDCSLAPLVRGVENCDFVGTASAISAVLNKIEAENRAVLFVFDAMHRLPADFDYSAFVYLIKHAPSNLKIVLSATEYFKLDFTRLEPDYPYIVGAEHLPRKADCYGYEEYLSDLDDEQKSFLKYVADFSFVIGTVAERALPGSESVLKYLVRKGVYVYQYSAYGEDCYILENGLREYLLGSDYAKPNYADVSYEDRYFSYVSERGPVGTDLTHALELRRYADAEGIVKAYCTRDGSAFEIYSYAKAHPDFVLACGIPDEYAGLNLLRACALVIKDPAALDPDLASTLVSEYEGKDLDLYYGGLCVLLNALAAETDAEKVDRFVGELKAKIEDGSIDKMRLLHAAAFADSPILKCLFTITEAESYLRAAAVKPNVWYPKLAEIVAFQYVRTGNYRSAYAVAETLRAMLPGYIIPAKISAVNYFGVGPELGLPAIKQALAYAEERDDNSELSLLYSVLAISEFYKGDGEAVERYMHLAMSNTSDKRDDESRFFALMVRSLLRSLGGDVETARRLAHSCLKYAEAHCPKYVVQAATAYAYASYKIGDRDTAYAYATEAIRASGGNRSCAWMLSTGIIANCLFSTGDLRDVDKITDNMLKVVASHGLTMVVVNFADDVFEPLLKHARANGIEPETVARIDELTLFGKNALSAESTLKIGMFGDVSISVNGKEIQWKTRKSKELFLHYVLAGDLGIDRNVIIDYLWKGYLYESAINNLKTTNNIIRNTLTQNGIEFKLQYVNSRYVLTIDNVENDYELYKKSMDEYCKTDDVKAKAALMDGMLSIYKADFATDMSMSDFTHERIGIKQEMIINLIKLVKLLTREGEYTEAKRFLGSLILIDKDNDYSHMTADLDKFIKVLG